MFVTACLAALWAFTNCSSKFHRGLIFLRSPFL
jgi:hypothetical protein